MKKTNRFRESMSTDRIRKKSGQFTAFNSTFYHNLKVSSHKKNTIPLRSSHMEKSITEFQSYIKKSYRKSERYEKPKVKIRLSTLESTAPLPNDAMENHDPVSKKKEEVKKPMFLLSRNPYSKIVNAKSCIGSKISKFRNNDALKYYRLYRGDNTTIMPIAIKKIIGMRKEKILSEEKTKAQVMESNSSQTEIEILNSLKPKLEDYNSQVIDRSSKVIKVSRKY